MRRESYLHRISTLIAHFPLVALLGPRQCGKTTLAQMHLKTSSYKQIHYFDLEDPTDIARLEQPKTLFSELEGLIVIDEIQRQPDLFPLLRVLIDKYKHKQKWLILGSASRHIIQQSSETLAGRIAYIEITPFSYSETHEKEKLWLRGGFPDAYLAKSLEQSIQWRKYYIRSFLEQDIPSLGFNISSQNMRRFWMMLAHHHGQTSNANELANSLGLSRKTIKHYTDLLTDTFMIRQLQPWHENIKKRQIKTPKIYFRDSGIFHTLMNLNQKNELLHSPKLGASWEGFAIEEIIRHLDAEQEDCYFWGVHSQAELDLLIYKDNKRIGFEFKFVDAPKLTKSMKMAYEYLHLESLTVIYPGNKNYPLSENINVVGLENFLSARP